MGNPEQADSSEREPLYLFIPDENLTGIGARLSGFPLYRLEHLRGVALPVHRIEKDWQNKSTPVSVEIKVQDIAESLGVCNKPDQAEWWYGLGLGMTSNPYYDKEVGPTVIFSMTGGNLEEITDSIPLTPGNL